MLDSLLIAPRKASKCAISVIYSYNSCVILRGWKQIADHIGTGVRTAQRWEQQGLPVRRPTRGPRSHVIAASEELDSWVRKGPYWRTKRFDFLEVVERNEELRKELVAGLANLQSRMNALQKEVAALRSRRKRRSQTESGERR